MNERALRLAMVETSHRLHARGWVANHDGNLTARLGQDRFLATPTATSKASVRDDLLITVDGQGARLTGTARPFGELGLHLAVYAARADVHAVVHAHPASATAIGCAGSPLLDRPFLAEAVVSLGPRVPTVPFAPPGKAAVQALAPFLPLHDAVLLAGNGVLAWGADLEQAYLRLELVEHLARIALDAERVGGVRPLPSEAIPPLLASRRKAGLGAAAEATPEWRAEAPVAGAPSASDVLAIIRDELHRALRNERG